VVGNGAKPRYRCPRSAPYLIEGTDHSAADTLLQIGEKANQAYYEQTGKPIDTFLILPEQPV
jgi:hypothetical protein